MAQAMKTTAFGSAGRPASHPCTQSREYLKGRIYNNIRLFYPPRSGYRLRADWDRGPVDLDVLAGVHAVKDPTDPVWDWQGAIDASLH